LTGETKGERTELTVIFVKFLD